MNAQIAGVETERTLNFIIGVRTDETEVAVADSFARLAAYVAFARAQEIPPVVLQGSGNHPGDFANPAGGGGSSDCPHGHRSAAWWWQIALAENGGQNGWRTGFLGEEGRPGVAALSYDEQVAIADGIYCTYGDGAWGPLSIQKAYAAVPGG